MVGSRLEELKEGKQSQYTIFSQVHATVHVSVCWSVPFYSEVENQWKSMEGGGRGIRQEGREQKASQEFVERMCMSMQVREYGSERVKQVPWRYISLSDATT